MSVRVTASGVEINGRAAPLLSGSIHYWRLSPTVWEACLKKMRGLGLTMACTYIPWSVHETAAGRFDFGDVSPERDVARFIRLAGSLGFDVMIRPGPHINAELTDFGFPARVLDDPAVKARGPDGEPIMMPLPPRAFPAPSYSSEAFWRETRVWFTALAGVIRPLLAPNGPIFLVQCDNELSYFFRTGAYDMDYSDGAVAAYRRFVATKYATPAALTQAYGRKVAAFDDLMPPTRFDARSPEDLPAYLDWIEHREVVLHDALVRCRAMWEELGIKDILFTHNMPPSLSRTPFHVGADETALDIVGQDYYQKKSDFPSYRRRLLALEGRSRLPWSPEFSAGCYQAWPPLGADDHKFTALAGLMYGLRGFNFYMAVERDRWYGSPITRRGGIRRETYDMFAELVAFIREHRLNELSREASVLVVIPRAYDRLEKAATLFGNISPMIVEGRMTAAHLCDERPLGFARNIPIACDDFLAAAVESLDALGIPWREGDSTAGIGMLRRHEIVICPSFEFMEKSLQDDLRAYCELGGTLVIGPEVPTRSEAMSEYARLDHFTTRPVHKLECEHDALVFNAGGGRLVLVAAPLARDDASRRTMSAVASFLRIAPRARVAPPFALQTHAGAARRIAYLANPTGAARHADVTAAGELRLRDLATGEEFAGHGRAVVPMNAWHVRVMEMRP
ncbi:beta-galactosidase [bacterium]|nr:beta-galactosidase [bacterium]